MLHLVPQGAEKSVLRCTHVSGDADIWGMATGAAPANGL
eukprot:CAMPEP_0168359592 /NCGR_PEP_ID=MMETSP0228-20121227/1722_1 /TAXON_ID=133427 /ORGANISM="Protoceratium reticulatum, Strain CCCM 535 (=CCMP 1889)" /LENGTH=38 /DNA_ID= /DNA_START= /DNA_END= /DNA_ORIENTATION=